MTKVLETRNPFDQADIAQPIQRTLIVSVGSLAADITHHLPAQFSEHGPLTGAIALLDVDMNDTDLSQSIREKIAQVSRATGQAELAANGYELDRLRELALFTVIDLSDPISVARTKAIIDSVLAIARDGWGLDTKVIAITVADDWSGKAAKDALEALINTLHDVATAIIPLNRVNELGLEIDGLEAFARKGAAIVEALVSTPMRDVLQWSSNGPEMPLPDQALTPVGLARWTWKPTPIRNYLAGKWRRRVIDQWLAVAEPEQIAPAAQQAQGWFGSQGLLPNVVAAVLERSIEPFAVPHWSVPYPWRAAPSIDELMNISVMLAEGRAGAVELVLDEWSEWPFEQEEKLRKELAEQLDREPVAGIDLVGHFLKTLANVVNDAAEEMANRQDQLEEQTRYLLAQRDEMLAAIQSIVGKWPARSFSAWLNLLLRPWRWPGLSWEYWTLHNLAQGLEQLIARQAFIEREQVVVAAVITLYEWYEAVVRRTTAHVEEAADMLNAARVSVAKEGINPRTANRLIAPESPEMEAASAATALGGLGQLARVLDDDFVRHLNDLANGRYQELMQLTAVEALERMNAGKESTAGWWAELWSEATPLWLYDDARQPEDSRAADRSYTAVCAARVDQLQALLGLPSRPDWRWLPAGDRQHIYVMRWRTGVVA